MKTYYDGDIVERDGFRFRVNFPADTDHEAPWDDGDGRGIVSDWTSRDKHPGEVTLFTDRHGSKRYFDWSGTIAKAKLEGWGLGDEKHAALEAKLGQPPTRGQIIEASVRSEFDNFRKWLNDEWQYVGIVITHIPAGDDEESAPNDYTHAVWGFDDSDDSYLSDEVDGMIDSFVVELTEAKAKEEAAAAQAAQEEERRDMANHEAVVALRNAILWSHFTDEFKLDLQLALSTLAESAGTDYPPK
jgi:hypothetical protein